MKSYKFSASTSFYKRGKYVEGMYQQLLNQTYTNWEWIVTDDFSPEDSAEEKLRDICAKDPRVKYVDQEFKMQLFYNPQTGCVGDIILQADSDDIIAPKLMEHYNYWFNKRPEVYGISCNYHAKIDLQYPSLVGPFWDLSNHKISLKSKIANLTTGRAWRNVIPHFESENFKWYQNDTNIIRHVENVGKWFVLPRVFYLYNNSGGFSFLEYDEEDKISIEEERQIIENRFPKLNIDEECTYIIDYLSIYKETNTFLPDEVLNFSKEKHIVNFIDPKIETYKKELIRELYWDWDIIFNDFEGVNQYDRLFFNLHFKDWEEFGKHLDRLKNTYPDQTLIIRADGDFTTEIFDSKMKTYAYQGIVEKNEFGYDTERGEWYLRYNL